MTEHKSPVAVARAHVDYGATAGKKFEEGEGFVRGDGAAEVVHEDGQDVVGHAGVGEDDFVGGVVWFVFFGFIDGVTGRGRRRS